jgi:nucleoside-diphosphate-sugar epimerase
MQTRAFTHLEDVARGTLLGLKPLGYEILNLGGHESIAILDLARKIEALVGRKADLRFCPASLADARGNQADVTKATRLLGWRPAIPLEQGLASLVDWYNAERAWTSKVLTP